ncbi:FecCD family ABC transporter permease [Chelativorans salis]|uniref:Iron ABC transporter permease n=1 Tax=Chelativorans salis TaxID=2978478 RepID=A0ABT2LN63_9HYPH|nr:iron ABC transporter permease [Chelativorans sp. EGI FJ00035]MCT7376011.1 iron ABC transporter permease [Chelativorans sp. EGI FJ00035]
MTRSTLALLLALPLLALSSLHFGVRFTPPAEVWRALTEGGTDQAALIVTTLRLPRTLIAVTVGAGLALSGLLMQTVTRNVLAEPGLMGVNAGGAFAAVLLVTFTGEQLMLPVMLAACGGAMLAAATVYGVARLGGGAAPLHLLLAGFVIAALLMSGTQIVLVSQERSMEELLFWLSGSFAYGELWTIVPAAAVISVIAILCLFYARSLDVLTADDATAGALGLPVAAARSTAVAGAALLAGVCVAIAGPVAFVGLAAPHVARRMGARGHAALIPLSMLAGAVLALLADILSRFVVYPTEAPVGSVLAMIGVPVLLALLRRRPRLEAA